HALLSPTISILGEVEWLYFRGDNYHLGKFKSSPSVSLFILRAKLECDECYVLFRARSFLEELRGLTSPTLATILDAAYWNDTVAIWVSRVDNSHCTMANRASSIP